MHTEKQEIAMIVQLSSGQGPSECELAVLKLYEALKKEYPDIEFLSAHEAREKRCYTSIIFTTENGICQIWKEAFNGYVEVHFDRIISGKTGL